MASVAANTDAREQRRYAPDELLDLRSSLPFVTCAVKKLNQHPELACILRIPDQARKDPEHFSCTSRMLVEFTSARSQQADRRRVTKSSSRGSEYQSLPDALGNQENRQLQWALRKRESSDRSSQPHSAPTDTAAQHSENFQKFYRAVVSPTHVRVTAGGRIVPNTRATAPPLLEWNNVKSSFEPTKQTIIPEVNTQPIWPRNPQLNSGFAPLIPNTFLHPYNLLPQGNSLTMPNMASPFPHAPHGAEHGSFENGPNPQLSAEADGNLAQAGLIKLSPPTQFDGSRPFVYNGQVLYPVGVPGPQMPFGMVGNSNYFPPSPMAPAGFMPQAFPVQMANLSNSMAFPPGHPGMISAGATPPSEGLPTMAPFMSMSGPILNSDALKSQVAALRQQLKNVEDQLSNNNQVDPGYIGHQRVFLQSQINNLEAMIEHQRINQAKGANGSQKVGSATMFQNNSKQSSAGIGLSTEINRQAPVVVSSSMATNKHAEKNGAGQLALNTEGSNTTRSEPGVKSRLTMAAAMAPPFQPRAQTLVGQNVPDVRSPSPDFIALLESNPKLLAECEADLMSYASCDWTSRDEPYVTFSHGPPPRPAKKSAQAPMQRSDAFHGTANGTVEDKCAMQATAVPYLVGTLPHGVNVAMAKTTDFMYPRPLTDEEVRARYLYWGKAPRAVQSGLPKFDGKDFYPPSPIKSNAAMAANGKESGTFTRNLITGAPMHNPNFDRIFISPSPKGKGAGWVTLGPVPPKPNFRNDTQTQGPTKMADESNVSGRVENHGALILRPCTPPSGGTAGSVEQDVSRHFTDKSPASDRIKETVIYYYNSERESPFTPQNRGQYGEEATQYDEVRTQDSWERDEANAQYNSNANNYGPSQSVGSGHSSSTVDFDLGSQGRFVSTAQRPDNVKKVERQTMFLQGMLKNETPMVGSALSGTISSATAQGYLPPYRGSAAASFNPAVMNSHNPGLGADNIVSKPDGKHFAVQPSAITTGFHFENVPLNSERYPRAIIPPNNAEAYMRYLALKDENNKQVVEQGWNANTSGAGPIKGSDW